MAQNKTYKIAVIPGDGTGPEVVREAVKGLETVSAKENFKANLTHYDLGGERYLRTGEILPAGMLDELRSYDAILLGAIGHPDVKPGVLEKGLLLELRFQLDQYINLRPVVLYPGVDTPLKDKKPEDINFVVVRENTEGLYAGARARPMKWRCRNPSTPAWELKGACASPSIFVASATRRKN